MLFKTEIYIYIYMIVKRTNFKLKNERYIIQL